MIDMKFFQFFLSLLDLIPEKSSVFFIDLQDFFRSKTKKSYRDILFDYYLLNLRMHCSNSFQDVLQSSNKTLAFMDRLKSWPE